MLLLWIYLQPQNFSFNTLGVGGDYWEGGWPTRGIFNSNTGSNSPLTLTSDSVTSELCISVFLLQSFVCSRHRGIAGACVVVCCVSEHTRRPQFTAHCIQVCSMCVVTNTTCLAQRAEH